MNALVLVGIVVFAAGVVLVLQGVQGRHRPLVAGGVGTAVMVPSDDNFLMDLRRLGEAAPAATADATPEAGPPDATPAERR